MASFRHKLPHDPRFDKPEPLPCQKAREAPVVDEHAHLDVLFLRALREVCARNECPRPIDDNALCMEARVRGPWHQRALVVVDAGTRVAEWPALCEEAAEVRVEVFVGSVAALDLGHVHEEPGVNRMVAHGPIERRQDIPRILEAVSAEDHALARPLEELAQYDSGIPRGA